MTTEQEDKNLTSNDTKPALSAGTRLLIGSEVVTPHGKGIIVAEEVFRTCGRWGVKLDKNPFSFPVAFYFKNEIQRAIGVNSLS